LTALETRFARHSSTAAAFTSTSGSGSTRPSTPCARGHSPRARTHPHAPPAGERLAAPSRAVRARQRAELPHRLERRLRQPHVALLPCVHEAHARELEEALQHVAHALHVPGEPAHTLP